MVKAGDRYFVLGGTNGMKVLRSVEAWDEQGNWQWVAPMQKSRMNFAATVLDGTIYAFGGVNERKLTTSSIERYVDGAW